ERLYAAAEDPLLWPDFLEALADSVHGTVTAIASEDLRAGHASVASAIRFDSLFSRAYEDYYSSRNVWKIAGASTFHTGQVVTSQMLLPDRELVRSEYYAEFLKRQNARHLLGAIIFRESHRLSHLSILRPSRLGEFTPDDTALLRC